MEGYSGLTYEKMEKAIQEYFHSKPFGTGLDVEINESPNIFSAKIFGKLITGFGGFVEFMNHNPVIMRLSYNSTMYTEAKEIKLILSQLMSTAKMYTGSAIVGTMGSGEESSQSFEELFNNPEGWNIKPVPNIWQEEAKAQGYFMPYVQEVDPYGKEDKNSVFDVKQIEARIKEIQDSESVAEYHKCYPRTQEECVPAPYTISEHLTKHGIYHLPDMVYQTVGSIVFANGTKEHKMDAMRYALHDYIEDKHPGYHMHIFTEFSEDQAKEIHPLFEGGLYYTLKPKYFMNDSILELPVPLEEQIKLLVNGK